MLFTAVLGCKQRLESLKITLPKLLDEMPVVLVDWDCEQHSAAWARSLGSKRLTLVEVKQEPYWHRSRALNTGAKAADTPWLCFFDADTLVATGLRKKLEALVRPKHFGIVRQDTPLTGVLVVEREAFDAVGGYYEALPGRGWQDVDLRCRLHLAGYRSFVIPKGVVTHLPHAPELRAACLPDPLLDTLVKAREMFWQHMEDLTRRPFRQMVELHQYLPGQ